MTLRTTFYARHCCSFSPSYSGWRQGHRPRPPGRRARKASSLARSVTARDVVTTGVACRMPHRAAVLGGLVGDHPLNFRLIRFVHHGLHIEMAFALGSLRSQDVALESVSTLELARTCLLEALRRSTVCLQLRHSSLFILQHLRRIRGGLSHFYLTAAVWASHSTAMLRRLQTRSPVPAPPRQTRAH